MGRDASVLLISAFLPLAARSAETDIISTGTATYVLIGIAVLYSIVAAVLFSLLVYCLCHCKRTVAEDETPLTPKGEGKDEKPTEPPQASELPPKPKVVTPEPTAPQHPIHKDTAFPQLSVVTVSDPTTELGGIAAAATGTSGSHTPSLTPRATPRATPRHSMTSLREQAITGSHGPIRHVLNVRDSPRRERRRMDEHRVISETTLATASVSATPRETPHHSMTNLSVGDAQPPHVVPSVRSTSPRMQRKYWEHLLASGTPSGTPTASPKQPRVHIELQNLQKHIPIDRPSSSPSRGRSDRRGPSRIPQLAHPNSTGTLPPASEKLKLRETPDPSPPDTPKLWVRGNIYERPKGKKFTPKHTPQSTPKLLLRTNTPPLSSKQDSVAQTSPDIFNRKGVINPLSGHGTDDGADTSAPNVISLTRELSTIAYKWFDVGMHLKVKLRSLLVFRRVHGDNTEQCMSAMFEEWLRTAEEPSWDVVVGVLRSRVINETTLASSVETRYCGKPARLKPNRISDKRESDGEFFSRI